MNTVARRMAVGAVAVVCLAACGGGTSVSDGASLGAEPAGRDGSFQVGAFADLPRPAGAVPFEDPAVEGSTTTQSYEVEGSTPAQLLAFYADQLAGAGWTVSSPPAPTGATDWAGEWARSDKTLAVSAGPIDGRDGVASQLDLILTR